MKKILLLTCLLFTSLLAYDFTDLNQCSEEAKKFGESELLNLKSIFPKKNEKEDQAFFPSVQFKNQTIDVSKLQKKEDQGKVLEGKEESHEATFQSTFERDLDLFLQEAEAHQTTREDQVSILLGDPAFNLGKLSGLDPNSGVSVVIEELEKKEEKSPVYSCIESGKYQAHIKMNLRVSTQTKKVLGKVRVCNGHLIEQEEKSPERANSFRKRKIEELEKDPDVALTSIDNYVDKIGVRKRKVYISYHHLDGVNCEGSHLEDKQIDTIEEKDLWEPEDVQFYNHLKQNLDCQVEFEQLIEGPETRFISGNPIFREVWGKRICFTCGIKEDSKCQRLRQKGGKLIGKKCLQETDHGECEFWEKDYELPSSTKASENRVTVNTDNIWGIGDEFSSEYEKNRDFGSVIASLSLLGDLQKEIQKNPQDVNLNLKVFEGEPFICKKNKLQKTLYDCCGSLNGGLIKIGVLDCNAQEKELQKAREDGRASWVGKKKKLTLEGWSEANCYCVFPTKLARIVQEYARKRGINAHSRNFPWGAIDSPNCQGISLEQLANLDFEEMDLGELMGDFVEKNTSNSSRKDSYKYLSELDPSSLEEHTKELMKGSIEENLESMQEKNYE